MSTPRMRTAPEAVAELKALDPSSALSVRAVRQMINSGILPAVTVGNKKLINLNILLEYLNGERELTPTSSPEYGKIRRIDS